jgi:superoxide dismutase, Cu-Zn family
MGRFSFRQTLDKPHSALTVSNHLVAKRHLACRLGITIAVAGTVLAITPMADPGQDSKATAITPASYGRAAPASLIGSGTFSLPDPTSKAITYNTALVPVDAAILASIGPSGGDYSQTVATMAVAGLLPNRGYAVHAHTKPCGTTGTDAGPHYQNHLDPAATPQKPSTDPFYANPRNEIWLDVRTNAAGEGTSRTTVPFAFTDRMPGSIVIHEAMSTATGPGQAGQAGARIACLTLSREQSPAT